MNKKSVCIVAIYLLLTFPTSGCSNGNYFRTFPLYSEVYVEHPDFIKRFAGWKFEFIKNTPLYLETEKRVLEYLDKNQNVDSNIIFALKELKIQKGMGKEQVILVLGKPTKKRRLKNGEELWVYEGERDFSWYYGWSKLRFQNSILTDIEVQYINISK